MARLARRRERRHQFTNTGLAKNGWRAVDRGCLIRTFTTRIGAQTKSHAPVVLAINVNWACVNLSGARRQLERAKIFRQRRDLAFTLSIWQTEVTLRVLCRPACIQGRRKTITGTTTRKYLFGRDAVKIAVENGVRKTALGAA